MTNLIVGFGLGVAVGIFHLQLWAWLKPLLAAGWAKFQAWRAKRNAG